MTAKYRTPILCIIKRGDVLIQNVLLLIMFLSVFIENAVACTLFKSRGCFDHLSKIPQRQFLFLIQSKCTSSKFSRITLSSSVDVLNNPSNNPIYELVQGGVCLMYRILPHWCSVRVCLMYRISPHWCSGRVCLMYRISPHWCSGRVCRMYRISPHQIGRAHV